VCCYEHGPAKQRALKCPKKQREIGKKNTKQREEGKNKKKVKKPTNLTTVAETNEKRKKWNANDKSKE